MFYFIINPTSKTGLGKKLWEKLRKTLDEKNVPYAFYYTKRQYHTPSLIQEILEKEGEKHIVVIGGDGSLNEAVNGFTSYKDATLSYIPSGSGNDFARSIGLSKDPQALLNSLITAPSTKYYDQGICHLPDGCLPDKYPFKKGRKFCISCGMGFDASICYEALHSKLKYFLNKIKLGKLTYGLLAIKQIATCPLVDMDITVDGKEVKHFKNVFFLAGMVQPYEGGGFRMTHEADATDGKISVAIYHSMPKIVAVLIMLPRIMLGLQNGSKSFDTFSCQHISVQTSQPVIVHTDGEYAGKSAIVEMGSLPEKIAFYR